MADLEDAAADVNALVRRWLLSQYRQEQPGKHLSDCLDTDVVDASGEDGAYGCDTGCEYVRLSAFLACSHGDRDDYEYGTFGDLATILEDLIEEQGTR